MGWRLLSPRDDFCRYWYNVSSRKVCILGHVLLKRSNVIVILINVPYVLNALHCLVMTPRVYRYRHTKRSTWPTYRQIHSSYVLDVKLDSDSIMDIEFVSHGSHSIAQNITFHISIRCDNKMSHVHEALSSILLRCNTVIITKHFRYLKWRYWAL